MRVSEYYKLDRSQPTLEFVDVDIRGDVRVFIDPRVLRLMESDWSAECVGLLQSFFSTVLDAIRAREYPRARRLLGSLNEPNETRLGLSAGKAQGRGMGDDLARTAMAALLKSRAVKTGLLEDLEDAVLFVEGIGFDIISDITTNIIRRPLIQFTHDACRYYDIPLVNDVVSGRLWDSSSQSWTQEYTQLPVTSEGPLLLVPKAIVRRSITFDPGEYYNHYILPYLQEEELAAGSPLVHVLKNGRRQVTKKSVKEKYGTGKRVNLDVTIKNDALLDQYRQSKSRLQSPLGHSEIAELTETPEPDWDDLLASIRGIHAGKTHADQYHKAVEALLSALLYPALIDPKREHKIHQGRKRIDIRYRNVATSGFFNWLHAVKKVPSSYVPVECKNYGAELGNPEFDQLAGRFSVQRGQFGILCHRGYGDKALVVARCRDTALDGRGFIVALDDDDLAKLVEERKAYPDGVRYGFLAERFEELT